MMLDIAKEFSPYPSGRSAQDGEFNGTRFRDDYLVPRLKSAMVSNEELLVNIDGVRTFGSSFLEEAFAGLIRQGYFSFSDLEKHLKIISSKPHLMMYSNNISRYISDASKTP